MFVLLFEAVLKDINEGLVNLYPYDFRGRKAQWLVLLTHNWTVLSSTIKLK